MKSSSNCSISFGDGGIGFCERGRGRMGIMGTHCCNVEGVCQHAMKASIICFNNASKPEFARKLDLSHSFVCATIAWRRESALQWAKVLGW